MWHAWCRSIFSQISKTGSIAIAAFTAVGAASATVAVAGSTLPQDVRTTKWPRSISKTLCDVLHAQEEGSGTNKTYYTPEEVSQRNGKIRPETWVSYQGKVYDITEFLDEHPGGEYIRDAAGGPLEPYWAYWAYHTAFDRAPLMLQKYEIGRLHHSEDGNETRDSDEDVESLMEEMYATDPDRDHSISSGQVRVLQKPWCTETDPKLLGKPFTPNHAFYVRNHAPVPVLDEKDFEITLECDERIHEEESSSSQKETSFSLESLKKCFPVVTINSVLQCAGNRGSEMIEVAPTAFTGTPFEVIKCGMIGNATWKGVRLRDVLLVSFPFLRDLDVKEDNYHVEFEGVDGYKTSTPLRRILDKSSDALLVFEMNGHKLLPDHGFPVRVFLPGIAGARSVKWVYSIRVQREECTSCFQQTYYKDFHGRPIQEMPMQSFMISKQQVGNQLHIAGIAWGGGSGVGIRRVEVSADDGKSWRNATLHRTPQADNSREWSWVHFETRVDLDPKRNPDDPVPIVISRAIDGNGLQQPEKLWYPKGYLSNGWHRL